MSHKKFGPDRFSRFDVYWIKTNRQTDRQAKFIYRLHFAQKRAKCMRKTFSIFYKPAHLYFLLCALNFCTCLSACAVFPLFPALPFTYIQG